MSLRAISRLPPLARSRALRPLLHPLRYSSTLPPAPTPPSSSQHLYNLPKPAHPRPPPTHRHPDGYRDLAAEAAEEAASLRRRRWILSALGATVAVGIYLLATAEPVHAEAPAAAAAAAAPEIRPGVPVALAAPSQREKELGVELIPSGTSSVPAFPRTLVLEEEVLEEGEKRGSIGGRKQAEYALVGLGIRTVSFLGIQVYVVGFYVHADDLAALQTALVRRIHPTATVATQTERQELRRILLGPVESEELFTKLLAGGEDGGLRFRSAFRIVPTRNTDFHHLRDGWVRGIQARSTKLPEYDDERFAAALSAFKSLFSRGAVPKQKTLLLYRDADGVLEVLYDPSGRNDGKFGRNNSNSNSDDAKQENEKEEKEEEEKKKKKKVETAAAVVRLGSVHDARISSALWLCYLAGKNVASPPARESIVDGMLAMVERPSATLGTATLL